METTNAHAPSEQQQPTKLFVSTDDISVPLFDNKFLDMFTRVHWTVPAVIYLPLVGYFMYCTFTTDWTSTLNKVLAIIVGLALWSLFEYIAHRFIFHYHPTSQWGKRLHFMVHGVHHDYPQDHMRLVMPPSVSVPLAVVVYYIFLLAFGEYWSMPLYGSFVFGYLCYDMMHYATHHATFIKSKWFRDLKKHHMDHHYRDPDAGFGVSSTIWDKVWGSGFKD